MYKPETTIMRSIFILLLLTISFSIKGQPFWQTSFELGDTLYQNHFHIDTVNYPNNIWHIGVPQKPIINSAYDGVMAIITDTINPCPPNDTSVFFVTVPAWQPVTVGSSWWGPLYLIEFFYQLDIDSGDKCTLEISRDSGQSWINYLDDSTLSSWNYMPDFDSSPIGWVSGSINCFYFPDLNNQDYTDSIIFRFTFISDSIQSNTDGWALDKFRLNYWFESVVDVENNDLICLYPNPSDGHIKLQSKTSIQNATIQVYNLNGQKVFEANAIGKDGNLYCRYPMACMY